MSGGTCDQFIYLITMMSTNCPFAPVMKFIDLKKGALWYHEPQYNSGS